LPQSEQIELALYNLTGQKVATLAHGLREAGTHTLRWDGRDDDEQELASGVYLYRLTAGDRVKTRKLLLLR
jgi:flagellar hook assembly protein FlgD